MGGLEFSLIMATIRLINGGAFDTAGFCGAPGALRTALVELQASRIVFATDYPQEICTPGAVREFVDDVRRLGTAGEQILSGNVGLLLKDRAVAASARS